jgi:uroporphyrinogen III methyltransferase/synthase
MKNTKQNKGKVYLVGAGPGDAELITLRAAGLLQTADCVIYDKLANPVLLEHTRKDAEIIHTPKRTKNSFTQQQINELIIERALKGLSVVRLKGGDPGVFGRTGDELACLLEYDIPFEIVPGITAGTAAAEYAGIIPTDRKLSSQLMFVTGRSAGDTAENVDYKLLAEFAGTIVFYMPVGELENITQKLLDNNINPDTPAAVIQNATTPKQRAVYGNIKTIAKKARQENITPPAVLIIGKTAAENPRLKWFGSGSLSGQNIIITRDREGNRKFAEKITNRGGNPIPADTFEFDDLTGKSEFIQTLAKLKSFEWVIFTSANGVKFTFERLGKLGKDARVFGNCSIAAIGTETAKCLSKYGIKANFVPDTFTSEKLGEQMMISFNLANKKILLLRSSLASNRLKEILQKVRAVVKETPVYNLKKRELKKEQIIKSLDDNEINFLIFTSPFSAETFFGQVPYEKIKKTAAEIVSIGPVTSDKLKQLGVKVHRQAKTHTTDGILEILEGAGNA